MMRMMTWQTLNLPKRSKWYAPKSISVVKGQIIIFVLKRVSESGDKTNSKTPFKKTKVRKEPAVSTPKPNPQPGRPHRKK